jgi:hypothetical protein
MGLICSLMSTSLRQRQDDLATTFATGVLHAIRGASIEDLLAESGGGRRVATRARGGSSGRASAVAASAPSGEPSAPSRAGGRRRTGRLARRSAADIGQVIDRIVALVKQSPKGLRAEEIRRKLDMLPKEMPRPLKEAVESGRLSKSGQKRATTYVAKGAGAASGAGAAKPARPARGAGARKARKAPRASGGPGPARRAKKAKKAAKG